VPVLTFCETVGREDQLPDASGSADIYQVFDTMAQNAAAGSNSVIFTPWLYGERTPVENDSVRSGIFNLSLSTTREHLVRAIFEGVAYNSRWLLGYVEKFIKKRLDPIHMIGGGANSKVWCQIFADVFNRTIKQVKDPIQANLRGAAFLAAVSMGYLSVNDISNYVQIADTYQPNPQHRSIYDNLYREFLELYKKNKGIFRRLNAI
jgi:xylulokinase